LKLFRYLAQRRDELDLHLPGFTERLHLTTRGEFTFHLAVFVAELGRLDVADRAEALLLVGAMNDLAAIDLAVFVERDDEGTAQLAKHRAHVGLLLFRMILLRKDQLD